MSVPTIRYRNNERTVRAVVAFLDQQAPAARSLNAYPSDTSARAFAEWWLHTGSGRPTPGRGRLFMRRLADTLSATGLGLMAAGLQVERGLGRHLAGARVGEPVRVELVDPRLVMQPSWSWYRLLNDTLGDLINVPLNRVLERSAQPIAIDLQLHHADQLTAIPGIRTPPADHVSFSVLDESLLLHPTRLAGGELAALNDAATLRDLLLRMEGIRDLSWYWITVSMGVEVAYNDEEGGWDAATLWHNALEPWLPWVH